jgi:putative endopeptidase
MMFRCPPPIRAALFGTILAVATAALAASAATDPASGVDTAGFDPTCKACDDFYQFVNGGWIKSHPIPASESSYGAFSELADRNQAVLRGLLDDATKTDAAPGTDERKIGDFYAACMDTQAIDANGTNAIAPLFADVADVHDLGSLAPALAKLERAGVNAFFGFGGGADVHDARMTIAQLRQGGLSLPDRDYYLKTDDKTVALRAAFIAYATKTFTLLGDSPDRAASEAATVLRIETALAQNQISRIALRDPAASDHKTAFADLVTLAPNVAWVGFYEAAGVPTSATLNVGQPTYFKALSDQLGAMPIDDVKTELRWQIVRAYGPELAKPFDDAYFAFYSTALNGVPQQQERWKRCVRATDQNLGEALGRLYVAKAFPPAAKAAALEMVENIKQTFRDDLAVLDWMSPETRDRAIAKLDAFALKIGYPDKWRDYSKLAISRDSYAANVMAASEFRSEDNLAHIGKPVDRARWGMTPPTVNAYYNPTVNEIVFPAGILQPPFYFQNADMAINYGGIGAVIGHESTHGFDDQGRKFGPDGNLTDLWTADDVTKFNARADCVVKQFDALSPAPGVMESGKLVEGEEIADLGGLTIAYKAFEKWQATHPRQTLDGYSPEQRFFIGFAQLWASNHRPEEIALRAKTDVHAYDKFRVNATVANLPGFAFAFFCKQMDPMYRPPAERCAIW